MRYNFYNLSTKTARIRLIFAFNQERAINLETSLWLWKNTIRLNVSFAEWSLRKCRILKSICRIIQISDPNRSPHQHCIILLTTDQLLNHISASNVTINIRVSLVSDATCDRTCIQQSSSAVIVDRCFTDRIISRITKWLISAQILNNNHRLACEISITIQWSVCTVELFPQPKNITTDTNGCTWNTVSTNRFSATTHWSSKPQNLCFCTLVRTVANSFYANTIGAAIPTPTPTRCQWASSATRVRNAFTERHSWRNINVLMIVCLSVRFAEIQFATRAHWPDIWRFTYVERDQQSRKHSIIIILISREIALKSVLRIVIIVFWQAFS